MDKDDSSGILIILAIVAIALFGGVKNTNNFNNTTSQPTTNNEIQQQNQTSVEQKINNIEDQIEQIKKQIQTEEDKKTQSQYKDKITLAYINRSSDPNKEYVTIKVSYNATGTIPITGWVLKSSNTGMQVSIPKATYLFFTGMINTEDDIYLQANDTLYLVTGISPNGASFKVNKCSGYLGQFQTFVPYLSTSCPLPKNENLSEIPKLVINDACFDYIDSMGRCKISTKSLPINWSLECKNFITNKINYLSCVNTHKNDKDFYQKEWRVYLKRSERIWKDKREVIVLYDDLGKIVDTLSY
jgi:hypothetical protein